MTDPKIELHVHIEGTIRPATLLELARANGERLPADTVDGLAALYEFTDFAHFIEVWILTTNCLRSRDDFRRVVVDYAAEAAGFGAVYLEGIFSPCERVARGVAWADIFEGYLDGAAEARERFGVEIRYTPDLYRGLDPAVAEECARVAVRYRDRGVVGLGLGGMEKGMPSQPYARAFAIARDGGLALVPHAGEVAGADSVRDILRYDPARIRHGIRAVEDPDAAGRDPGPGHRAGRLPDLQPAYRRRRRAGRTPAAGAARRRHPVHGQHRRPGHVRHRPGAGVRAGRAARGERRRRLRRRAGRGAVRRCHQDPARRPDGVTTDLGNRWLYPIRGGSCRMGQTKKRNTDSGEAVVACVGIPWRFTFHRRCPSVTSHDLSVYLILSAGLLAMPIGAYGLLEALNKRRTGKSWVTGLIATYAFGVLLCAFALALNGWWYAGAVLTLMLVPVETALKKHGLRRRRVPIQG